MPTAERASSGCNYLSEAADPPPQQATKRAMRQAAIGVWFCLQQFLDNIPKGKLYWPDRYYASLLQADANKTFTVVYDNRIDLIGRAAECSWCTLYAKMSSGPPVTQYLMVMASKDGKLLEAGNIYKLDLQAEMPIKQFWALTVYDRATMAFIYSGSDRTTPSSYDLGPTDYPVGGDIWYGGAVLTPATPAQTEGHHAGRSSARPAIAPLPI